MHTSPHAETALQQEGIFRTLVESVRDYAIFLLDSTGVVRSWNPGAETLKQYQPNEIIGKHFSIFYPQVDLAWGKPDWELKVASENGRFEDEGWRLRKDGSRFWANVVITAIRDKSGALLGFGKITRDLTERRVAEQRFRLLIEGVTDYAIYSLDANGNITSWNSGAQRIKGYSADEVLGRHFSLFYTPEDTAVHKPDQVLAAAREDGHWEGEGWRVRKDGTRFWSSVVVTAIRDEEGTLTGYSKVTRDISDRKKLVDELKKHAAELESEIAERERTNAELEAFSYSVSHDLRAPLRAIEGFANALQEDYGDKFDDTARDYLHQIMNASARMNRLVQDLLEYGRLSRIELAQQPVELKPLLESAVSEAAPEASEVVVQGADDVFVCAHPPTVSQILYNLLSNATKFRRKGAQSKSRIKISVSRNEQNGMAHIAVSDDGIGIAPQHQERIFKVFERLHGSDEYPGTGIGLAIVKRGVERMGGRVGVESEPGQGSTFWVELPTSRPADKVA